MKMQEQASLRITINDNEAGKKLEQLKNKAVVLNDKLNEMRKLNDKLGFDKVKREINETNREIKSLQASTYSLDATLKNLNGTTINELTKAQKQLQRELKNTVRGSEEYNSKLKQLGQVNTQLAQARKDLNQFNGEAEKSTGIFSSMKIGIMAVVTAVISLGSALMKAITVRAQFEKFEAVLTNTLGSKSEARKALEEISKFAARTPYQVDEITDAFVKLANRGVKLTIDQMTRIGDTAAALGKPFEQVVEAILDINNNKRWTEIGIKSETTGNKVKLSFKGMTQEVDRTEAGVIKAIEAFGKMQGVSGTMAAISKTIGGQLSNLKDSWTLMLNAIGERLSPDLKAGLSMLQGVFQTIQDWAAIPVSEKMEQERVKVNMLVSELTNANTSTERRKTILKELNEIAPEVTKNINAEAISYETLRGNLAKYNQEAINKIVIQKNSEALAKSNANYAQAQLDRYNAEQKILENMQKELEVAKAWDAQYKTNYYKEALALVNDEKHGINYKIGQLEILAKKYTGLGTATKLASQGQKWFLLTQAEEDEQRKINEGLISQREKLLKAFGVTDETGKVKPNQGTQNEDLSKAIKERDEEMKKAWKQQQNAEIELMEDGMDKELALLQVQTDDEIEEIRSRIISKAQLSESDLKFNRQLLDSITAITLAANKKWFEIKAKYNKEGIKDDEKTAKETIKLFELEEKLKEAKLKFEEMGRSGNIDTSGALSWKDAKETVTSKASGDKDSLEAEAKAVFEKEMGMAKDNKELQLKAELDFYNKKIKIQEDYNQKTQALAKAETDIRKQVMDTSNQVMDALAANTKEGTALNKAALIGQKALAIAQIVMDTQKQISAINTTAAEINAVTFGIGGTAYAAVMIPMAIAGGAAAAAKIANIKFYSGGYTKPGDKYEPAGIVHAGEYVIPQEGVENQTLSPFIQQIELARQSGALKQMNFEKINHAFENYRLMAAGGYVKPNSAQLTNQETQPSEMGKVARIMEDLTDAINQLKKEGVNGVWEWDRYKKGVDKMGRILKRVSR